jgi:uncharacterized protein
LSALQNEPLPPYSFVPGGPWPHPTRSPQGHSYGQAGASAGGGAGAGAAVMARFRRGAHLFNAGYYWEAHEVWEGLWHACGRHGATALLCKALIKLAAAGVKVREGQEHGVVTHARRAAACFAQARELGGRFRLGLDLDCWTERARELAANPPRDPAGRDARVVRVFDFEIEPDDTRS